jgi:Na+/H+-dicarboxylate symporter
MSAASTTGRPWYRPSLTTQIMIGLIVGALIGWLRPDWGNKVYFLRDIFINLIKSIIAPLVLSTIVVGIAGAGALKKIGRIGIKALIFFEMATTAALFIGLAIVNLTKPGAGVTLAAGNIDIAKTIGQTTPKVWSKRSCTFFHRA